MTMDINATANKDALRQARAEVQNTLFYES